MVIQVVADVLSSTHWSAVHLPANNVLPIRREPTLLGKDAYKQAELREKVLECSIKYKHVDVT